MRPRRCAGGSPHGRCPFATDEDALTFFGGDTLWARTWAGGLDHTEDGLRPAFDADVMVAALGEGAVRSYWAEWAAVRCPTLVVLAHTTSAPSLTGRSMVVTPTRVTTSISTSPGRGGGRSQASWRNSGEYVVPGTEYSRRPARQGV